MSKKDKKVFSLAEDYQAVIAMIPKLEGLLKTYKEIAEGYQLYRKNGGKEISGIEEHLGFKEQISEHFEKTEKIEKILGIGNKAPEKNTEVKKAKKKGNHTKNAK